MMSPDLEPRPVYETLFQRLHTFSADELARRQHAADQARFPVRDEVVPELALVLQNRGADAPVGQAQQQ